MLSGILFVSFLDHNKATAQGGSASSSNEFAVATGTVQGQESVLWIVTKDDRGNPKLLTYTSRGWETRLLGARTLQFDLKMRDVIYPAQGRNPQPKAGVPPVTQLEELLQQEGGGGSGRSGGRGN